jgi:hypothetical protein
MAGKASKKGTKPSGKARSSAATKTKPVKASGKPARAAKPAAPKKSAPPKKAAAPAKAPNAKATPAKAPKPKPEGGKTSSGKKAAPPVGAPSKTGLSAKAGKPNDASASKPTSAQGGPAKTASTKRESKGSAPVAASTSVVSRPSQPAVVPAASPSRIGIARPSSPSRPAGPSRPRGVPAAASTRGGEPRTLEVRGHNGETFTLVPSRANQQLAAPTASRPGATTAQPARGELTRTGTAPATRAAAPGLKKPAAEPQASPPLLPLRKVEEPPTIEQRFARVRARLDKLPADARRAHDEKFDKVWVYHDSALEGVVYTLEELNAGLGPAPVVAAAPPVPRPEGSLESPASSDLLLEDSTLQPAADEIRRHKEALDYVREAGLDKPVPITVDVIKKIYLILHPSEGDLKTVRYRRDIPQHRLYFHEYAEPDKILVKVRQVVDWLNDPETNKGRNVVKVAARAHYDLLRIFPFQTDSGKVARLFLNLLLYREGFPPAIIHSTERQRYYDALKGNPNTIQQMVQEAVENGLVSVEKMLDERDARSRG